MDGTEVGIVHSPHPAQSTAHQTFRRLLGRSTVREGVLLYTTLATKEKRR